NSRWLKPPDQQGLAPLLVNVSFVPARTGRAMRPPATAELCLAPPRSRRSHHKQEKTMLKIYGIPFSVHTRKVIVAATFKKLSFENEPVIPFTPPPGWNDISPTGKIPPF